jgi:fucose 4-O-acetylase-like acetyltransferase
MRSNSIDIISGVMIVWMVVYHIFMWAGLTEFKIYQLPLQWLFFFMPWFYFKSGMFQKNDKEITLKNYVNVNFNKLILPLVVWSVIGLLVSMPEMILFDNKPWWKIVIVPFFNIIRTGDTFGNPPLWFLLSLFLVKICGYFLINLNQKIQAIVLLIALIIGVILSEFSILLPFGMHNVILGLIFYFAGFYYKKNATKKINLLMFCFVLLFFVTLNSFYYSYIDVHLNELKYGSYIGYIFLSILAIILSIKLLENINIDIKALDWVGKKSMYVLVLHWPILTIIRTICRTFNYSTEGYKFAYVLLSLSFPALLLFLSLFPDKKIKCG